MKALILRDDADAAAAYAHALINKGFQVVCVETRKVAQALIRLHTIDLLVMDERMPAGLTHTLALSAERRNPYVSTIMLTDRPGWQTDELYELIPSLYGLVGLNTPPALISQLALSSIENYEEAEARVRRNAVADAKEEDDGSHCGTDEAEDMTEPDLIAVGQDPVDDAESECAETTLAEEMSAVESPDERDVVGMVDEIVFADELDDADDIEITTEECGRGNDFSTDEAAFAAEAELPDDAFDDDFAEDALVKAAGAEQSDPIQLTETRSDKAQHDNHFDETKIFALTSTYSFVQSGSMIPADHALRVGAM